MDKIWEFFENLQELVYVIDIETQTFVYMNHYTKKKISLPQDQDYHGKKCYEVLLGLSSPCPFCSDYQLIPGIFHESRYTTPLTQKTYAIKATAIEYDGKIYRMEIAVDVTKVISSEAESSTVILNPLFANNAHKDYVSPHDSIYETLFQKFVRENYFDAEAFFQSVAIPDAPYYLYFGDLQTKLYYISDNMRDDFKFSSNVVYDLIEKWGELISDPQDKLLYHQDLEQIMEQKKGIHSLRYRVTDKNGRSTWVHCRGIVKWSIDKNVPLFFSGCVSRLESNFSLDPVTGLLRVQAALNELASLSARNSSACIISFSLNHFTYINESRGRIEGDNLLQNIANALLEELDDKYIFYRLDGIRFMAISRHSTCMGSNNAVRRIRSIIEKCYTEENLAPKQSASFGVLHFPENARLPQEVLENATMLINIAKMNPELEFCEFSQDLISKQKDKSKMTLHLSDSVANNCEGFRIVVQPIVCKDTGRIIGGETLLRWKYQGQDVSPIVFIPLLEQTHMILQVGKWVFEQVVHVCQRLMAFQQEFLLSFNVSYLQILDETFLPFMKNTLEASGVPGSRLMLELTETHFDDMPSSLHDFVIECQKMGIKFALDDFGNGFSSLQLLFKYPVNVIKLDRTLMSEITHSTENLDFIMSIVYACHRSGKQVCVEGVETNAELSIVRQTDCDMIQGFYFYRPLELDDLFSKFAPDEQI
ncbi:MAG: bifunctional diguanylate cyclase/phosphodiesterase [Eubacteriales bacterium]|nr:bifunctional diguanylate cyclase/phosphodiesterase [Eubacteriales bacterium]